MTPKHPFWRGLSGINSGGPIRSRALLFTPELSNGGRLDNPRYRPKDVFGKGVGNSTNASEMRQKCVKNASSGSCFIGKRGTFQNASDMRQNCVKNARNTFAGEHL